MQPDPGEAGDSSLGLPLPHHACAHALRCRGPIARSLSPRRLRVGGQRAAGSALSAVHTASPDARVPALATVAVPAACEPPAISPAGWGDTGKGLGKPRLLPLLDSPTPCCAKSPRRAPTAWPPTPADWLLRPQCARRQGEAPPAWLPPATHAPALVAAHDHAASGPPEYQARQELQFLHSDPSARCPTSPQPGLPGKTVRLPRQPLFLLLGPAPLERLGARRTATGPHCTRPATFDVPQLLRYS
jgi:hypothetical protein